MSQATEETQEHPAVIQLKSLATTYYVPWCKKTAWRIPVDDPPPDELIDQLRALGWDWEVPMDRDENWMRWHMFFPPETQTTVTQ